MNHQVALLIAFISQINAQIVPAYEACVANEANFEIYWFYTDLASGTSSDNSPDYDSGTQCMQVDMTGLTSGATLTVNIQAVDGDQESADRPMMYLSDLTNEATYTVTGSSSSDFTCTYSEVSPIDPDDDDDNDDDGISSGWIAVLVILGVLIVGFLGFASGYKYNQYRLEQ